MRLPPSFFTQILSGLIGLLGVISITLADTHKMPAPLPLNGTDTLTNLAKERLKDPLSGVIINRTVTVQGHEFYQFFAMWWHQLDENSQYSITIYERPSARWGSEIWIDHRQNRVFHTFLPPARSRTKSISQQAAEITYERIEESVIERALSQSDDLGPEEM